MKPTAMSAIMPPAPHLEADPPIQPPSPRPAGMLVLTAMCIYLLGCVAFGAVGNLTGGQAAGPAMAKPIVRPIRNSGPALALAMASSRLRSAQLRPVL